MRLEYWSSILNKWRDIRYFYVSNGYVPKAKYVAKFYILALKYKFKVRNMLSAMVHNRDRTMRARK